LLLLSFDEKAKVVYRNKGIEGLWRLKRGGGALLEFFGEGCARECF
jgi:hypothetical protein